MFSLSKKNKPYLSLIIDIQSSVVRGSLILMNPNQLPHKVWRLGVDIPYHVDSDSAYLIDSTVKAIEQVSTSVNIYIKDTYAHSGVPSHIEKVHCVLSSPWIRSEARTVSQKFEHDTKITRVHVSEIIKSEREKLYRTKDERMEGIEEKIFEVRLNGYSIPKWENTMARSLEVSFAISLASKNIIQKFISAVGKCGVSKSHIDFHSSLLLQHIGMNVISGSTDPYILVHVHGELTDIVVSSGQACILFGSHPTGLRKIIRELAIKMNTSESSVDSTLNLYETGELDPLHAGADVTNIQTVLNLWVEECKKITSLIPETYFPLKGLISARFHELLFKTSFGAGYPSLKVDVLPTEGLFKFATFDPKIEKLRLTVLYIIAIRSLENI